MRIRHLAISALTLLTLGVATASWAQPKPVAGWSIYALRQEQIAPNEWALVGNAEIQQGDTSLFADEIDYFVDQERAVATGNVLLSQGANRIGADSAEFDTKTRLGTFHHAYGIATMKQQRQAPPVPGSYVAPQLIGQDNDVYFFGDVIEKIGPKKYKITNGGFTTCLQPTPRWNLHADTIIVNVNHYTMLKDAVLNVKGVPLLYLPFLYYPTKEDNRATGILLPVYGTRSLYGQSITNQFFWAIDRSQDLTISHDWFSQGSRGYGGEYRYNWGGGSIGTVQGLFLDQKGDSTLADGHTFTLRGSASQVLPGQFRASGNVSYFSSLTSNQAYNVNLADSSNATRNYNVNVSRSWRTYWLNANFYRSESFYSTSDSTVSGNTPVISLRRPERQIKPGVPVYFSASGEYAHIENDVKTNGVGERNQDVSRFDFSPTIRVPFTKWPFFTVSSSVQWRDTVYTRSLGDVDPTTETQPILDEALNRQYVVIRADIKGPTFSRIFNTPDNGYAEKFRHTIEPVFTLAQTIGASTDVFNRTIKSAGDYVVGDTVNFTYGLNNRIAAKRRVGPSTQTLDILEVRLTQTYYTNVTATQYDLNYSAANNGGAASHFTPFRLDVTARPNMTASGTLHAEFDSQTRALRQLSLYSSYNLIPRLQASAGWNRYYSPVATGSNQLQLSSDSLNFSTRAQTRDNRFGGDYTLWYDLKGGTAQQQIFSGFYNAQCCGIAARYIKGYLGSANNNTFAISITLAGLGSVSPMNGMLTGLPH